MQGYVLGLGVAACGATSMCVLWHEHGRRKKSNTLSRQERRRHLPPLFEPPRLCRCGDESTSEGWPTTTDVKPYAAPAQKATALSTHAARTPMLISNDGAPEPPTTTSSCRAADAIARWGASLRAEAGRLLHCQLRPRSKHAEEERIAARSETRAICLPSPARSVCAQRRPLEAAWALKRELPKRGDSKTAVALLWQRHPRNAHRTREHDTTRHDKTEHSTARNNTPHRAVPHRGHGFHIRQPGMPV